MWLDEAEVSVLPAPAGTLILKEGPGAASGTGGAGVGEVAVPFTAASEELAAALLTLPDVAGVQVSPAPSFFGWSSWDVTFTHVNQRQLVPMLSGEGGPGHGAVLWFEVSGLWLPLVAHKVLSAALAFYSPV